MTDTSTEEPFNLAPTEAAALIGMSADSLAELEKQGRIECRWTPGGHRRYRRTDVLALLSAERPS